jgi:RNA polymerase sigma-70 factor (ECF subfamily)
MPMPRAEEPNPAAPPAQFASTHWSLVLLARDRRSPAADEALAALCRAYWYPLYVYIRRRIGSADEAEELTQEFFTRLLQDDFLANVDQSRGRFRAYLLACCNHFLANERDRARALKRGGGRPTLSLDFRAADQRYGHEPADTLTPQRLFERRWALLLLDATLERLRGEFHQAGKGPLYERLKATLLGDQGAVGYGLVAADLGMTEAAVKKAAQRLKQRYREVLCDEIAATVDGPERVDEEIRDLFAALAS